MKFTERISKLFVRLIAGLKGKDFETVVDWVVKTGADPRFKGGMVQAKRVAMLYDITFIKQASWVVSTVVQIAYLVSKLRGLKT